MAPTTAPFRPRFTLRWRDSSLGLINIVYVLCFVLYVTPSSSFLSSSASRYASVGRVLWASTQVPMPPADLTPAIDKYVRLPQQGFVTDGYFMSAKGPAPGGPEPFGLVSSELEPLSNYVKDLVASENPVLTMAAGHFFDQRQGKRFRPTIVALMARALTMGSGIPYVGTRLNKLQIDNRQITEMIHVASLIHDDVLDEAEMRRGGQAVHTMYTNKVAVLAGDYLLAKASVLLARLQHFQVVEVMASALDALVQGEIMQARSKKDDLLDMNYYLRKSYFKTASLISSSCRSSALLAGYDEAHDFTVAAEEYGYAHQQPHRLFSLLLRGRAVSHT